MWGNFHEKMAKRIWECLFLYQTLEATFVLYWPSWQRGVSEISINWGLLRRITYSDTCTFVLTSVFIFPFLLKTTIKKKVVMFEIVS